MSNAYLSPILQDCQFSDDLTFLAGGLIWFYEAGTSTPLLAYTSPDASSAWTNPIVLDARGETGGEIWLKAGSAYKMILESAPEYGQTHGVVISTFDNINGVNDPGTTTLQNWVNFAGTPTYISSTSFSTTGDTRTTFLKGRRVKMTNNDATIYYGTVVRSTYATGVTTVVVSPDYGQSVSSQIASIAYGFIETGTISSIPVAVQAGSATSGALDTIWIDYDSSLGLRWAINNGILDSTWPINAETADNASGSEFSTASGSTQGIINVKRNGVNNVSFVNDTSSWGLLEQTVGYAIQYNRSTTQYSYGGFTLPNPSSTKYIKFPNGLIAQFGQGTASSAGGSVTFPTTFPTQCFAVVATQVGSTHLDVSANNLTTTGVTLHCSSTEPASYIALGF